MGRRPFVRQRILEAAFDLVARRGYEAVSTREIAAAAAVGHASMYRHFPSKEALGRALYAEALPPLEEAVAALDATRPRAFVAGLVDTLYRAYDQRPRALALLVFPPHEFVPHELDPDNPHAIRSRLETAIDDRDRSALVWGAICGPLVDRYLRRRVEPMAPLAPLHGRLVQKLLPSGGPT